MSLYFGYFWRLNAIYCINYLLKSIIVASKINIMVILNFFNNSEINKFLQKILKISFIFLFLFTLSCSKKPFSSDVDKDRRPMSAKEKRRQNIDEGRGASLGGIMGAVRGGGNFEFSSSNPMWRASLETLDFLPLTTVDYSGGVIISDWYSDNSKNNDESIKITIRFLSNEIRSNSLKIIVHKKNLFKKSKLYC